MKLRGQDGLSETLPEGSGIYAAVSEDGEVLYVGMASRVAPTIRQHELSFWARLVYHRWVAREMPYSELTEERKRLRGVYQPRGNSQLGRLGRKKRPKWIRDILRKDRAVAPSLAP